MKLFASLLKTDPFQRFAALEKKADAQTSARDTFDRYQAKLEGAIQSARASWKAEPTETNLEKLRVAIETKKSLVLSDLRAEAQNDAVYLAAGVRKSPEAIGIYTACLEAIKGSLADEVAAMRSRLTKALTDAGDEVPNVDAIPAVQKLNYQISDVESAIGRLAMPVPLSDQDVLRVLTLIRGQLPTPPAPATPQAGMVTLNNKHRAEHGIGDSIEPPAPVQEHKRLVPPTWAELNGGRQHELTGHRL